MNYSKIYDALIVKCKKRGNNKSKLEGYHESHHIIPKSVGGSDKVENLVLLTSREHFIAHMILWKMYPDNVPLAKAAFLMSNRRKGAGGKIDIQTKIKSREYKQLREAISEIGRFESTGEKNPFYGKTHSPETKARILQTKIKNGTCLHPDDRPIKVLKGGLPKGDKHHMWGKTHKPESVEKSRKTWVAKDLRPWENPTAVNDLDKWVMCDYYYDLWSATGKKGLKVFTKIYNKLHNTNHSLSYFTNPRIQFLKGWVPTEDTKWNEFRFDRLDFHGGQL